MFKKRKPKAPEKLRLVVPEKHKDYYKDELSFINSEELFSLLDLKRYCIKDASMCTDKFILHTKEKSRWTITYKHIRLNFFLRPTLSGMEDVCFEKAPGEFVPYYRAPQVIRPYIEKQIAELAEIIREALIKCIKDDITAREKRAIEEQIEEEKEAQAILKYWEQE